MDQLDPAFALKTAEKTNHDLTSGSCLGKVGRAAFGWALRGLVGVCVWFENSTVCFRSMHFLQGLVWLLFGVAGLVLLFL